MHAVWAPLFAHIRAPQRTGEREYGLRRGQSGELRSTHEGGRGAIWIRAQAVRELWESVRLPPPPSLGKSTLVGNRGPDRAPTVPATAADRALHGAGARQPAWWRTRTQVAAAPERGGGNATPTERGRTRRLKEGGEAPSAAVAAARPSRAQRPLSKMSRGEAKSSVPVGCPQAACSARPAAIRVAAAAGRRLAGRRERAPGGGNHFRRRWDSCDRA